MRDRVVAGVGHVGVQGVGAGDGVGVVQSAGRGGNWRSVPRCISGQRVVAGVAHEKVGGAEEGHGGRTIHPSGEGGHRRGVRVPSRAYWVTVLFPASRPKVAAAVEGQGVGMIQPYALRRRDAELANGAVMVVGYVEAAAGVKGQGGGSIQPGEGMLGAASPGRIRSRCCRRSWPRRGCRCRRRPGR